MESMGKCYIDVELRFLYMYTHNGHTIAFITNCRIIYCSSLSTESLIYDEDNLMEVE